MADKENGFILGFFEEFLEEYMQSNSSYSVVSERHSGGGGGVGGRGIITSVISLRGRRSRGKGKGIRARDRT